MKRKRADKPLSSCMPGTCVSADFKPAPRVAINGMKLWINYESTLCQCYDVHTVSQDNQRRYGSKVCQFPDRLQRRLSAMHKRKCRSYFINNLARSTRDTQSKCYFSLQSLPAEIRSSECGIIYEWSPKWNYPSQCLLLLVWFFALPSQWENDKSFCWFPHVSIRLCVNTRLTMEYQLRCIMNLCLGSIEQSPISDGK